MSRAGRRQTQSQAASGPGGRRAQDARRRVGGRRAGASGSQRTDPAGLPRCRRRRPHAAGRVAPDADRRRKGAAPALGRGRRGLPAALVVPVDPLRAGAAAPGERGEPEPDRRLHRAPARRRRPAPCRRGVARDRHPPGRADPDGPAADRGRDRRLPRRRLAQGVRAGGRSLPRVAGVRRAHGPGLARPGALRRHLRLPGGRGPRHVAVPRLGHPGLQRQPALRPVPDLAARGRSAAGRHPRSADRHGLQPAAPADQRRRQRRGGVPHRIRGRPGQHVRHGHAGPDARVRQVPRPQVRSDHAARLLRAVRVLQQHRRVRALFALHERDADAGPAALAVGPRRHARPGGGAHRRHGTAADGARPRGPGPVRHLDRARTAAATTGAGRPSGVRHGRFRDDAGSRGRHTGAAAGRPTTGPGAGRARAARCSSAATTASCTRAPGRSSAPIHSRWTSG